MIPSLFPRRHERAEAEHRLCRQNAAPEQRNFPGVDALRGYYDAAVSSITALFNRDPANRQATERNLRDPAQWLRAFESETVFDDMQSTTSLEGREFGPEELLKSKSREQRVVEFYRFVRQSLPAQVIARQPEFNDPAFRAQNFDVYLEGLRKGQNGPITLQPPSLNRRREILTCIGIVLGVRDRVVAPGREQDLALACFHEIYPDQNLGGHIYTDYATTVAFLQRVQPQGITLSNDDLRSRDALLRLLSTQGIAEDGIRQFLGWMRAEDPTICQTRLNALADQRQKNERRQDLHKLDAAVQYEQINAKLRKEALQMNTSFMGNFNTFEPWQQYAAIGLGIWAAYLLSKKEGRLFGIFPYWTIPTTVLGTYLYLRLVNGDTDAVNTMTGTTQNFLQTAARRSIAFFRRTTGTPEPGSEDIRRLALMGRFLNERAFLESSDLGVPLTIMARMPVELLAGHSLQVGMDQQSAISYSLNFEQGSALEQHRMKIMREEGYDPELTEKLFVNNNARIAKALAISFYYVGARKHPKIAREVEQARQKHAKVRGFQSDLDFENIPDRATRQQFVYLIQQGRSTAITEHRGETYAKMIGSLLAEPPRPQRPDAAEPVPVPGTAGNATRQRERDLYASRENPLIADRTPSVELIVNDVNEFVTLWSSADRRILAPEAADRFRTVFAQLIAENATTPLPDLLHVCERIKYAVLVAASARGGGNPLTAQDVQEIFSVQPGNPNAPGTVAQILSGINNVITRYLLTVDSSFRDVQSLTDVSTVLQQRFKSDVQSGQGGLKQLQEQIKRHQERFAQLQDPQRASVLFVSTLPQATINRFGADPATARQELERFVQRLIANRATGYQDYLVNGQRHCAQRYMIGLVTAQLTTHRRNGNHTLDLDPARRFISPTEERNVVAENEFLLSQIIGTRERPLNGMWAAMTMRQLLNDFQTENLNFQGATPEAEQRRIRAVLHVRQMAFLFLSLQPIAEGAAQGNVAPLILGSANPLLVPVQLQAKLFEVAIRERVRAVAREMINALNGPLIEARARGDALVKAAEQQANEIQKKAAEQAVQAREKGEKDYDAAVRRAVQDAAVARVNEATEQRAKAIADAREAGETLVKNALDEAVTKAVEAAEQDVKKSVAAAEKQSEELEQKARTSAAALLVGMGMDPITMAAATAAGEQLVIKAQTEGKQLVEKATKDGENQIAAARAKAEVDAQPAMAAARKRGEVLVALAEQQGDKAIQAAQGEGKRYIDDIEYGVAHAEQQAKDIRAQAEKQGGPAVVEAARKQGNAAIEKAQKNATASVEAVRTAADQRVEKARKAGDQKALTQAEVDRKRLIDEAEAKAALQVTSDQEQADATLWKLQQIIPQAEERSKEVITKATAAREVRIKDAVRYAAMLPVQKARAQIAAEQALLGLADPVALAALAASHQVLLKNANAESAAASKRMADLSVRGSQESSKILGDAAAEAKKLTSDAQKQKTELHTKAQVARNPDLLNENSYASGMRDIIATMRLLGISEEPSDAALLKALQQGLEAMPKITEPTNGSAAPVVAPGSPGGIDIPSPPPGTLVIPPAPGMVLPPAPGITPSSVTIVIPPPPGMPPGIPGIIIPPAPGMPPQTPTIVIPPAPGLPPATPWINIPPAPGIPPVPAGVPPPPGLTPGTLTIVVPRAPGFPPAVPGIVIVPAAPGMPAIIIPPAPGTPPATPWIVIPMAPGIPASMVPPAPGFTPPTPGAIPPPAPGMAPPIPSIVPPAPGNPLVIPPPGILPAGTPMRIVPPAPGIPPTMPGIVIPPAPGMPAGTPAIIVPPAPGIPANTAWIVIPSAPGFASVTPAAGVIPPPGITPGTPMIVVPPAPGIPPDTQGIVVPPAPGSPAGTPAIVIPPAPGVAATAAWLIVPRAPGIPARLEVPAPGFTPPVPGAPVPAPGIPPPPPSP